MDATVSTPAQKRRAPARWIWQRTALYSLGVLPAVWVFWAALNDNLGADPMKTLERFLGLWALRFLIASLAISPLRRLAGINLLRYRRALGLLAFGYAALHLSVYMVLDQGLDFAPVWADVVKRPFITIGMAAFLILLPLAITSNAALIRRLGGTVWQKLHRWVYVAVALGAVHFIMSVKAWPPEPLIYAGVVTALLGIRIWWAFTPKRVRAA